MNYLPNTEADQKIMLSKIGIEKIEDLFADIPPKCKNSNFDLPKGLDELALVRQLRKMANANTSLVQNGCFLGAGAYNHFIPSVVRHLAGRSEFYTAYTPYQPEISQGTLQAIFEYQSIICQLTGMDVANASLYDGASAMAEAAVMAKNITKRNRVLVSPYIHPDYLAVLKTYLREFETEIIFEWPDAEKEQSNSGQTLALAAAKLLNSSTACLIVQNPNFFGCLEDLKNLAEVAHSVGAILIVVVNPISLALLKPPADLGADIVVGEGHPLGNSPYFGGSNFGIFATREKYMRQMPGRIVGQTVDSRGQIGYVLTLQTREQHIRREKATSNICSNQALNALAGLIYTAAMGKDGLKKVAEICVSEAHYTANKIAKIPGFSLRFNAPFFNEFVIKCPITPDKLNEILLSKNIIGGYDLGSFSSKYENCCLFCVTEMNTRTEIENLLQVLEEVSQQAVGGRK